MKEPRKTDKVRVYPVVEDGTLYLETADGKEVANFDVEVEEKHIWRFCQQHGYSLQMTEVRG